MEQEAKLGLAVLAAVLFGVPLLYGLLLRFAYPMRVTLFERANVLLDRRDCTHEERLFINYLLDTALSFKAGWSVSKAVWRAAFRKVSGDAPTPRPLVERVIWIMPRYFASVLVANPFALISAMLALPILLVMARIREHEKAKDAFRDAVREVRTRRFRAYACH